MAGKGDACPFVGSVGSGSSNGDCVLPFARWSPNRRQTYRVAWAGDEANGLGPFPAIVALHGCGGLFKEGALVAREAAWAKLLASHGYVVLFPDRFGPRGVTTDCEGNVRAWAERSYAAYGALRYFTAQAFIIG